MVHNCCHSWSNFDLSDVGPGRWRPGAVPAAALGRARRSVWAGPWLRDSGTMAPPLRCKWAVGSRADQTQSPDPYGTVPP